MNLRMIFSSAEANSVDKVLTDLIDFAKKRDLTVIGPIPLPTGFSSFKPFEGNATYRRLLDIENPSAEVLGELAGFSIPIGVDVKMKYSESH